MDRVDAATTIEVAADLLCTGVLPSVTVTVTFEVPDAVGMPERIPLDANLIPAGRVPVVTDQT